MTQPVRETIYPPMQIHRRVSAFQSVVLEIIQNKLNMMVTECFQLKKAVDFNDYEKLTKIILREIARGHIHSAHMGPEDAQNAIHMLEALEENRHAVNSGFPSPGNSSKAVNPFNDGPFG